MSKPMFARPAAGSWQLLFRGADKLRSTKTKARQPHVFSQAFHAQAQASSYQEAAKAEGTQPAKEDDNGNPFPGRF